MIVRSMSESSTEPYDLDTPFSVWESSPSPPRRSMYRTASLQTVTSYLSGTVSSPFPRGYILFLTESSASAIYAFMMLSVTELSLTCAEIKFILSCSVTVHTSFYASGSGSGSVGSSAHTQAPSITVSTFPLSAAVKPGTS